MSRCLVTGAGFIGSHLTEELLAAGHHVTVLDNLSTGRAENLSGLEGHPRLTIRAGSITDQMLLAEVVRDADSIYHLAAAVGVKLVADDPVRTIETNIYPTEMLLQLAVQEAASRSSWRPPARCTARIQKSSGPKKTTCISDQPRDRDGPTVARKRLMNFWPWRTTASMGCRWSSAGSSTSWDRGKSGTTGW